MYMYNGVPDHPVIRNLERTGTPDGIEPPEPVCPICGMECETIYLCQSDGTVLGCDQCVESSDAYDVEECFPESEPDDYEDD